jgi:OmpA-OmpF porin, OOP family
MSKHATRLLALGLLVSVSQAATAQTAYTAADILDRFAPPPDLGRNRGLCIGSEAECNPDSAKRPAVGGFDLMVTFDHDSDGLTGDARRNLDEFAKALRDQRLALASFVVEGHTDGRGGEAYNLSLSERRANAVVRYLQGKGVDLAKLSAKGYGKSRPRVSDLFDPTNRRVETRLRLE